jgi:hypothetical protein
MFAHLRYLPSNESAVTSPWTPYWQPHATPMHAPRAAWDFAIANAADESIWPQDPLEDKDEAVSIPRPCRAPKRRCIWVRAFQKLFGGSSESEQRVAPDM